MKTSNLQPAAAIPDWLLHVQSKVEGLRFGIVQIVIHDNKVTQIEITEKVRFDPQRNTVVLPARHE